MASLHTFASRFVFACASVVATAGICAAQTEHAERTALSAANYVVGHDDVLAIQVWNQPSLSGKFVVDRDGKLDFPLIGHVAAAGLTATQVGEALAKQLEAGYVKEPHVSVTVEQFRSRQVIVSGEVKQPGRYAMTGSSTLLEAIAQAGSPTEGAGSEVIVLRRDGDERHVDWAALESGNLAGNIEVLDGDTIVVPKAERVYVFGQVKSPGSYAIRKGTTILQALALAGGLTDRGSDRKVKVVRVTTNGKRVEKKVGLQDVVLAGDSIVVEERVF